jgi:hypothetical protein
MYGRMRSCSSSESSTNEPDKASTGFCLLEEKDRLEVKCFTIEIADRGKRSLGGYHRYQLFEVIVRKRPSPLMPALWTSLQIARSKTWTSLPVVEIATIRKVLSAAIRRCGTCKAEWADALTPDGRNGKPSGEKGASCPARQMMRDPAKSERTTFGGSSGAIVDDNDAPVIRTSSSDQK